MSDMLTRSNVDDNEKKNPSRSPKSAGVATVVMSFI